MTTPRKPKFKPCPFCGREEPQLTMKTHEVYSVSCVRCLAWGPSSLDAELAAKGWNQRRGK